MLGLILEKYFRPYERKAVILMQQKQQKTIGFDFYHQE